MTRKPDGTWDKSNMPSRHVTEGPSRAPHRSYLYAMGLGTKEINQPLVGVASCWNQAAPCNTNMATDSRPAIRVNGVNRPSSEPS